MCENVAQRQQEANQSLVDPVFLSRLQRAGLQRYLFLCGGWHHLREPRRSWALPRLSGSLPKHAHTQGSLWGVKKWVLPAEWHQELLAGSTATMEVVLMLASPWHFISLLPGSRCRDYLFLFPVFSALSHCSPQAEGSRMRLYHWVPGSWRGLLGATQGGPLGDRL